MFFLWMDVLDDKESSILYLLFNVYYCTIVSRYKGLKYCGDVTSENYYQYARQYYQYYVVRIVT